MMSQYKSPRTIRGLVVSLAAASALSACSFTGVNSVPLPFAAGGDSDDVRVTVLLANSTNLVPNAEVKYRDVTVGSIRKVELDENWNARLTIGLDKDAQVPADVRAKVAQKSLLGAEYLALEDRAQGAAGGGELLATGTTIGLDRTGRYPETEEVLAAAALLFNNGGVGKLQTIARELNAALDGRTDDVKALVRNVTTLVSELDSQSGQIFAALEQVDRFSQTVRQDRTKVDKALRDLPAGVEALAAERQDLVKTLRSVDALSTTANRVLNRTTDGLAKNLANLRPVTKQIADHAEVLAKSLDNISFPFPIKSFNRSYFGDYINFFATLSIDANEFVKYFGSNNLLGVLFGPAVAAAFNQPSKGGAGQTTARPGTSGTPKAPKPSSGPPASPSPGESGSSGSGGLLGGLLSGLTGGGR